MKSYLSGGLAILMCALAACTKPAEVIPTPEPGPNPIIEPEQSIYELRSPYYVNSNLVYYGDDGDTGVSDWWVLTLYTDMEVQGGYPVGPGQTITLSFNAKCSSDGTPDTSCLVGSYHEQSNSGDFSAGTFMPGYLDRISLPEGIVETPADSFYGDIPDGTTGFTPVLIIEGTFTIELLESGQHRIQGVLVGNDYRKYYVNYLGILNPIDRSSNDDSGSVANSNLTSDISLDSFTQAALHDYGDSYMTGEQSYRKFVLFLAEDGVDLSGQWPKGSGKLLRAEFFVPYDADVTDGVPQANYTPVKVTETGGIAKSDLVPSKFVPGTPDRFSYSTGTWYQELDGNGGLSQYARITGGVISVARDGDSHAIRFELLDCSDPAYKVSCIWESDGPISTADYAID